MSIEAATAFRAFVTENPEAQAEVKDAITNGGDISAIGAKHGFEFTAEEGRTVWAEAQTEELSEFELEMVAGGGSPSAFS